MVMIKSELFLGLIAASWLALISTGAFAGEAAKPAENGQAEAIFGRVNGKVITQQEFDALYAATMRQRFYHGNIPEGQGEAVYKEVTELMVERTLLLEEAERRGLKPNAAKIEEAISGYEKRYANSPMWKSQREKLLPGLKAQLIRQDLLDQVDKQLREVAAPSPEQVRTYFDQHRELFIEPEKLHLSVILLKVDPTSPDELWKETWDKAAAIAQKIKDGASFADEARLNSADISAPNGGDLGYVHRGMLPEAMQGHVDQAKPGQVEGPIKVLEGVALYRLEQKIPPKEMEFVDVEARARELYLRDQREESRKSAISRLKEQASIEILESGKPDQK